MRARLIASIAVLVTAIAAATPWALRRLLWRWEQNPVLRGRLVAEAAGCPVCHRPYAGDEIPNPGSRWQSVPAFQGGNSLMYGATERRTIAEYVRLGAPARWLDNPVVAERLAGQRLRMPAYGGTLSDAEVADVTTYVAALEGVEPLGGEAAAPGRSLARRHGCLSCHGPEGAGGLPNPGSLGGFIPGFLGRNFPDLVRDRAEFGEWVLDGRSRRLEQNALVSYFWRRQKIAMPAYRDALGEAEVDQLWTWVQAVRAAIIADAGEVPTH